MMAASEPADMSLGNGLHTAKGDSIIRIISLNNADTVKFIQLYQQQELLWNVNLHHHTNKAKRSECLQRISHLMANNWSEQQVKDKIVSLRSRYSKEIVKVRVSIASGAADAYRPKWRFFPLLDSFLRPFSITRKTDSPVVRAFHRRLMEGRGQIRSSPPIPQHHPAATPPRHYAQQASIARAPNTAVGYYSHQEHLVNDLQSGSDHDDDVQIVEEDDENGMVVMSIEDGDSGYSIYKAGCQDSSSDGGHFLNFLSDGVAEGTNTTEGLEENEPAEGISETVARDAMDLACGVAEPQRPFFDDHNGLAGNNQVGHRHGSTDLQSTRTPSHLPDEASVEREKDRRPQSSSQGKANESCASPAEGSAPASVWHSWKSSQHSWNSSQHSWNSTQHSWNSSQNSEQEAAAEKGQTRVKQENSMSPPSPPPPPLPTSLPASSVNITPNRSVARGCEEDMVLYTGSKPHHVIGAEPTQKKIKTERLSPLSETGLNSDQTNFIRSGQVMDPFEGQRNCSGANRNNVSRHVNRTSVGYGGQRSHANTSSEQGTLENNITDHTTDPSIPQNSNVLRMASQVTSQVTSAVTNQMTALLQSLVTSLADRSPGVTSDAELAFISHVVCELKKLDEDLRADVQFSIQRAIYDAQKEMNKRRTKKAQTRSGNDSAEPIRQ